MRIRYLLIIGIVSEEFVAVSTRNALRRVFTPMRVLFGLPLSGQVHLCFMQCRVWCAEQYVYFPMTTHRQFTLRAVMAVPTGGQVEKIGSHRHIEHRGGELHMEIFRRFVTAGSIHVPPNRAQAAPRRGKPE